MSFVRKLLSIYRRIQCKVCGRAEYGIMPSGVQCSHTPFEDEINHGDVVHPCVRYIPEGYLGHKWWMVYSPYYAANDTTENPILCYGANDTVDPPTNWIVKYLKFPTFWNSLYLLGVQKGVFSESPYPWAFNTCLTDVKQLLLFVRL